MPPPLPPLPLPPPPLRTDDELEAVVAKDADFVRAVDQHAFLDTQFCVSLAFGESWASKKARIQASSPVGAEPGWDLVSIIVKSNDDLRQEVCALQLIGLCKRIFQDAQLDLYLQPYLIISTGRSTGLMQTLTDAMSLDALKKRPGYVSLAQHFSASYGGAGSKQHRSAQRNLAHSLAAYSLVCYVFQIKDRHNGNILLDTQGHIVHIDFGFMLGIAPGGQFSIETSPFKLTADMVSVMGGLDSKGFMEFVVAFTCGFLALQSQRARIVSLVEIMMEDSPFPCFQGKDTQAILRKLQARLAPTLDKHATVAHCLALIRESYDSYATRQYDNFQWMTNGIMP
ncbi:kinase-like domain-containing protein [Tribonema minus]|uniref:1-phosphatidylinositol 4-kinase n=1 Tax=Tribonema minus TaxID=303371 RepID=A0A835YV70_9STRA|nr:kinase-like domain-containing protein [Tribonema minus]